MRIQKIALLLAAVQLAACNSGSGDSNPAVLSGSLSGPAPGTGSPPAHFEGNWQGTITPDDTKTSVDAVVIVNGWGELRLYAGDIQMVGWPRRIAGRLEGDVTGFRSPGSTWTDGSQISLLSIDGTIDKDEFINATYVGVGGSGTIALAHVTRQDSVKITAISGLWVQKDANQNNIASFDIEILGGWEAKITGTHANGCIYSGEAESWTSFNSYDIPKLEVSGCPLVNGVDINGTYVGSAALFDMPDDGTDELALVLGISSDDNQLTFVLYHP